MTDPGNFDPAREVEGVRKQQAEEGAKKEAEAEAEKQRAQAEQERQDLHRANVLKLLRYAEEQLEEIRNPVVSEFVVAEGWWTPEPGWVSSIRHDQRQIGSKLNFFASRLKFKVATRHERQTRYHGSWLALSNTYTYSDRGKIHTTELVWWSCVSLAPVTPL